MKSLAANQSCFQLRIASANISCDIDWFDSTVIEDVDQSRKLNFSLHCVDASQLSLSTFIDAPAEFVIQTATGSIQFSGIITDIKLQTYTDHFHYSFHLSSIQNSRACLIELTSETILKTSDHYELRTARHLADDQTDDSLSNVVGHGEHIHFYEKGAELHKIINELSADRNKDDAQRHICSLITTNPSIAYGNSLKIMHGNTRIVLSVLSVEHRGDQRAGKNLLGMHNSNLNYYNTVRATPIEYTAIHKDETHHQLSLFSEASRPMSKQGFLLNKNNYMVASDDEKPQLGLFYGDNAVQLLDDELTSLHLNSKSKDLSIVAKRNLTLATKKNHIIDVNRNYHVDIHQLMRVSTQIGGIRWSSGKESTIATKEAIVMTTNYDDITMYAKRNLFVTSLDSFEILAHQSTFSISVPQGECLLESDRGIEVRTLGAAGIRLSTPGACIELDSSGAMSINAKKIIFDCDRNFFHAGRLVVNTNSAILDP